MSKKAFKITRSFICIAGLGGALVQACSFGPDAYTGPGVEQAPPDESAAGQPATSAGGAGGAPSAASAGAAGSEAQPQAGASQ
jgi:hypothetical protein